MKDSEWKYQVDHLLLHFLIVFICKVCGYSLEKSSIVPFQFDSISSLLSLLDGTTKKLNYIDVTASNLVTIDSIRLYVQLDVPLLISLKIDSL